MSINIIKVITMATPTVTKGLSKGSSKIFYLKEKAAGEIIDIALLTRRNLSSDT